MQPSDGTKKKKKSQDVIQPGPYVRLLTRIDKDYGKDERGDMLVFVSGMQVRAARDPPSVPGLLASGSACAALRGVVWCAA